MRLLLAGCLFLLATATLLAAEAVWVPGVRIACEVRTPAGELRTYHTPPKFSYWSPDLPVIEGDLVTANIFVALGGGEMGQVKVRLDNELLTTLKKAPWKLDLPHDRLKPGYHFLEVWASSRQGRWSSGTLSFLVVPASEPSIRVALSPEATEKIVTVEPGPGEPTGPTAVVRARDEAADKALKEGKPLAVNQTLLLWVETAEGKQYFYTMEREGVVTYRSPALPLNTQILLEPRRAQGGGLEPGKAIMKVRAGDLAGNFGPPTQVTLEIAAAQ